MRSVLLLVVWSTSLFIAGLPPQTPTASEVRQIVTFSFVPGRSGAAQALFREQALPLYARNEPMLSFRGFREVESPVPLDLIVVSAFDGMDGMDASNERLGELAAEAGTSIGAVYGAIGALSSAHTDEFVEMLPGLGNGDPSATRLTAFVRYRLLPGSRGAFEGALDGSVAPWEADAGIPSATGRFLLGDGWDYLRLIGFESLGDYQAYWSRAGSAAARARIAELTIERQEIIVASVPELAVR